MTVLLAMESLNLPCLTSIYLSLGKSLKLPLLTLFYVSLALKFQILPFIGSHERGVTCKGVSEPPMLNIHLSVQHLGEVAVLYQTFKYKLLFVDMSKVVIDTDINLIFCRNLILEKMTW